MDYSGKIITKNAVTPTQTAASGVWTLDDALQAQKGNNWPIPGVPNPISKSLRFNSADSTYLNRTPSLQGSRRIWTWSAWMKRSKISATEVLFSAEQDGANFTGLYLFSDNTLMLYTITGATDYSQETVAVLRDVSAWYHVVIAVDTTQASVTNRVKIYLNGVQQTVTQSYGQIPQNYDAWINTINQHALGRNEDGGSNFFNGYLTETNFIDGQQLAASDFGMTDTNTGVWIPKKYTGTYGTNGFYVNFKDATNTSTLGLDYSGNGNNWNANNFSVTAGAGNDSLTDVPTPWVGYSVNGDTGGVVRGNYATLNPLDENISSLSVTLSNGNLQASGTTYGASVYSSTFQVPQSGKWYYEFVYSTLSVVATVGIRSYSTGSTDVRYRSNGDKDVGGSVSSYGASWTTNDVIGVALNMDSGTITFYKNGVSQGAISIPTPTAIFNTAWNYITQAASTFNVNFGQRPFAYTPPAGFLSLCTTNLPTPTIGATSTTQAQKYMDVTLYTGNGSAGRVITTNLSEVGLAWVKIRSGADDHRLANIVTGGNKHLKSNSTDAESSGTNIIQAFSGSTFTVGSDLGVNANASTYVAWSWAANGAGSSNTAGTITSTVSANTTAGFSIVSFATGSNTGSQTIGHGLGVAPSLIISKVTTTADDWLVYHSSLGTGFSLRLNTTAAALSNSTQFWGSTFNSTVFSGFFGSGNWFLANNTYVAYCFAPVAGYSAFGSYTGNGSADGPFIYLGFRPRFLLTKRTNTTGDWYIWDAARDPSNVVDLAIWPNYSSAEYNYGGDGTQPWDFLSNGIKARTSSLINNNNGDTYIYAAFSENPFKYSNAR